jgi:hypothetical protein
MNLNQILERANESNFMTIATMGKEGRAQAVTVEFAIHGDKVVFDSFINSRKYTNIVNDGHVALVIMPDHHTSIDIEGRAAVLLGGNDLAQAQEEYLAKIPEACKWANSPGVAFFAVTIDWARCTDVSVSPWKIDIYELEAK